MNPLDILASLILILSFIFGILPLTGCLADHRLPYFKAMKLGLTLSLYFILVFTGVVVLLWAIFQLAT